MHVTGVKSPCAEWQEVLTASISYLSLHDLVRISACSKVASEFLNSQLSSGERILARNLLRKALQQAHQRHQLSCVKWLLSAANIPGDILAAEEYFNIPRVTLCACELLVAAGVRVSYSQLVSAARNRVQGVHSWVLACKFQGLPSGLDSLVEEVCMCDVEGFTSESGHRLRTSTSPDDVEDLLYICLNTLGNKSASNGRDAAATYNRIILDTPAAQQLSSKAFAQLLHCLVEIVAKRVSSRDHDKYAFAFELRSWARLPAMQQMSGDDLYSIIRSGMLHSLGTQMLATLLDFPGVQLFNADQIVDLITVTLERTDLAQLGCYGRVTRLCRLPAAHEVPSAVCQQLFYLAVNSRLQDSNWTATSLIDLPGMQQVDTAAVCAMMRTVINVASSRKQCGAGLVIRRISGSLPAAAGISVEVMQELLQLAAGLGDYDELVAQGLMQLPAAQQLTANVRSNQP